jgi:hypothetical protein
VYYVDGLHVYETQTASHFNIRKQRMLVFLCRIKLLAADEEKDPLRPVDTFQTEGSRQHRYTFIIQTGWFTYRVHSP